MKVSGSRFREGNQVLFNMPKGFRKKLHLTKPQILTAGILLGILVFNYLIPDGKALAGTNESTKRLCTLKEVAVCIELIEPFGDRQEIDQKQIQTDIEMRLRQAGIVNVRQAKTSFPPGLPIIYVNVTIAKYEDLYGYNIDIIYLDMSPTRTSTKLRNEANLETSGLVRKMNQVRPKVLDLVDRFIKEYLSV
jgi:hypothetical protein